MSVYGRGTKNGKYIRQRNSYDNYQDTSYSSRVDNHFSHGFDSMIENARNKVIEQDNRIKKLEEKNKNEQLNINIDNKKYNIKKTLFVSSSISIISILNSWILINNFDPNSLFITLSILFNIIFFIIFISKYLANISFNYYNCFVFKKFVFFVEIVSLISILINTYYIFKYLN